MRLAVDLHLHSRYSSGVSPAMTFENIAVYALRKGLDIVGTGDCLQPAWLDEVEAATAAVEPGLLALNSSAERAVFAQVPVKLRSSLRFVLSTEVNCQPPSQQKFEGVHFLLYFPSFELARSFSRILAKHGDMTEGRPTVNLNPLQLLDLVGEQGDDCHLAPAHVFNPWFSALGTVGGGSSLDEFFVDHTSHLMAVETGLTSTPPMCGRVSSLDRFALFSCSDAHSLGNLGREYTLVEVEPNYRALFAALQEPSRREILGLVKFPLHRTPYFLNWCSKCQASFDAVKCPRCRRDLVEGSRDRLERIADRGNAVLPMNSPPFQEMLPLAHVAGKALGHRPESQVVRSLQQRLLETVGHERHILTEASEEQLAGVAPGLLARLIVNQRHVSSDYFKSAAFPRPAGSSDQPRQLELGAVDLPRE